MFHAADPLLGPLFFWAFTGIAVLCSLGLLISRHPLTGAVNLIGVMLSLSGLYALMNSPFLAVLQVLVYAGAIMVLVVFVIMVLNQAKDHKVPYLDWKSLIALPLPLVLGVVLFQVLTAGHSEDERAATSFVVDEPKNDKSFSDGTLIEAPFANSSSLTVVFRAHDFGNERDYRWDFGDAQTGNGRVLAHTYQKPGQYQVRLNVSKAVILSPAELQAAQLAKDKKALEYKAYIQAMKDRSERPHNPGIKPSIPVPPAPLDPPRSVSSAPVEFSSGVHMQVANVIRADVETVARAMFDTSAGGPGYYLLFEVVGVLLLAAVVAAVVLAKRSLTSAPQDSDVPTVGDGAEGHH